MLPGSRHRPASEEQKTLAERKQPLRLRARILQVLRAFFLAHHYLEVETPLLIPAPAPEPHIDAVPVGDHFLHPSPELCMKRLVCAGYDRIFQICRCFRHAERGQFHLPEFTLLEWYRTGIDYLGLMEECEALILWLSEHLGLEPQITYQGIPIDLKPPWERLSVKDAFHRYASRSLKDALEAERFDELMVQEVEPRLGMNKPTLLKDYPGSMAALSRLKAEDPGIAERFELYVAGLELANGFSELNDTEEQTARFERDQRQRRAMHKTVYPMPETFLEALDKMPDCAGIALGVDRLVMLFSDAPRIDDAVTFTPEEL